MPTLSRPRHGSLQFYPRKRIKKAIPSVNWKPVSDNDEGILGFITYKVGMGTCIVKDDTDKSLTKGKRKALPVTILEAPNMKIFSVRFYNKNRVVKDVIVSNDKDLKRIFKLPKEIKKDELEKIKTEDYDDIRVIVYSIVRQSGLKKKPDLAELAINVGNKLEFIKNLIGKEISLADVVRWKLVDVRGLTKGRGNQGPVRRFGINLKSHKSEKGRRNPGSIGPWHPAHVTFRVPMAGQLGMFTRVHYNLNIIETGNIKEEGKNINQKGGFKRYGEIKSSYIIIAGSVQGPIKRQILVTPPLRANKKQSKKKYEFISLK